MNDVDFNDTKWFITFVATIFVYFITDYLLIESELKKNDIGNIICDMLKFGGALIVVNLLQNNSFDSKFMINISALFGTIILYNLIISKIIKFDVRPNVKTDIFVHDVFKYGNYLFWIRLFTGERFDSNWCVAVLFTFSALFVYDYFVKLIVDDHIADTVVELIDKFETNLR